MELLRSRLREASAHVELPPEWVSSHTWKRCPACAVWLEKAGGCTHMHCSRCATDFCWHCMRVLKGSERDDHHCPADDDGTLPTRAPARTRARGPLRPAPGRWDARSRARLWGPLRV
ncbi:hypothetical protein T492DRAFT_24301 [Pavlovales sp. CCMP2436]|nr:hypothetical protein T492DRAFT_24301 [Pavlovales sp. CCMP2436]